MNPVFTKTCEVFDGGGIFKAVRDSVTSLTCSDIATANHNPDAIPTSVGNNSIAYR
jgi:hypothetical protein